MKPNRLRLLLAMGLFFSWISYLGFLVTHTTRGADGKPVRLSHPQFLTSELDLILEITNQENIVLTRVTDVLYSSLKDQTPKVGDSLTINNLELPGNLVNEKKSWLVPLRTADSGKSFEIMPVPSSPGFSGRSLKIYPALNGVLRQYKLLPKP